MPLKRSEIAAKWYRDWTLASQAKWLTDWMRFFPGVFPHWMSEKHWDNLVKMGMFVQMPSDHVWEGPARANAPEEQWTDYVPRDTPEGWRQRMLSHAEEPSRAPAPGKLFKMLTEVTKRFKVDYERTLKEPYPVVHFHRLTGEFAMRMAGAKDFIQATLYWGSTYRQEVSTEGTGIEVIISDDGQHYFTKRLNTPAAVRKNLNWAVSGATGKYYTESITSTTPGAHSSDSAKATPAVLFEHLANYLSPRLRPSHIMAVRDEKKLWEAYSHAKKQPNEAMLLLVEGLFVLFEGGSIFIGCPFKEIRSYGYFAGASDKKQLAYMEKHIYPPATAYKSYGKKHIRLKREFREAVMPRFRKIHTFWAILWKLLVADKVLKCKRSLVPGMTADEVLDNLRKSLHSRAVAIFAPEEEP